MIAEMETIAIAEEHRELPGDTVTEVRPTRQGSRRRDDRRPRPSTAAALRHMTRPDQAPQCWRFLAGPESTLQFVRDKRPTVGAWTVDRSGLAQRGDLVLLFGTGSLQSCVAIARVCSEAVENYKAPGRYRKKNREWWAYLQIQPVAEHVPRARIEALTVAQRPGSGLQQPRGSRANKVAPEAAEAALQLVTHNDAKAASRLHSWQTGSARWPQDLDLDDLRAADWDPPGTRSQEEILLCQRIAKALVRRRRFRYLTLDDDVGIVPAGWNQRAEPWRLSLEHRISDEFGQGRVDILLVDNDAQTRTLLAIEVKLRATPAGSRNPLPQIIRYRAALKQRNGAEWKLRVLVVAGHISDLVRDQAKIHDVPVSTCNLATGRLPNNLPELCGDPDS